jgi:hypothetical protein
MIICPLITDFATDHGDELPDVLSESAQELVAGTEFHLALVPNKYYTSSRHSHIRTNRVAANYQMRTCAFFCK